MTPFSSFYLRLSLQPHQLIKGDTPSNLNVVPTGTGSRRTTFNCAATERKVLRNDTFETTETTMVWESIVSFN